MINAEFRAGEAGANLTDVLERALRLIKDSLPPHERDAGFQEFHISFGNGIVLRDANGTMICAGHKRITAAIVAMCSNVKLSARVGGWISVEDSLPEWASRDDTPCEIAGEKIGALLKSEKVLVAIAPDNNVRIDYLTAIESNGEYQYKWFDMYGDRVTHWMPLPEAPNLQK